MTVNESCVSVEMFSGQQFSLLKIDPLNTFWGGCISKKKKKKKNRQKKWKRPRTCQFFLAKAQRPISFSAWSLQADAGRSQTPAFGALHDDMSMF